MKERGEGRATGWGKRDTSGTYSTEALKALTAGQRNTREERDSRLEAVKCRGMASSEMGGGSAGAAKGCGPEA